MTSPWMGETESTTAPPPRQLPSNTPAFTAPMPSFLSQASMRLTTNGHEWTRTRESQRDPIRQPRVSSVQVIPVGAGAGGTDERSRWEAPFRGAHPPVQVGKRPAPRRGAWRENAPIHAPRWGAMRWGSLARWVRLSLRLRLPTGYLHWPLRGRGTPSFHSLLPPKPASNQKAATPLGLEIRLVDVHAR